MFTQQGPKLTDSTSPGASQGSSVAVSGDGNTTLVGGPQDNNFVGAAWVYVRNNSSWVQQGSKLIGNGAVGESVAQGWSVALSGDGNTALVGGPGDKNSVGGVIYEGAVWVYVRADGAWTQQGNKLFGEDGFGSGNQGSSVALSADGNIAIFGGPSDDSFSGAAWVFSRKNDVWTQEGHKLVGSGATGSAKQGASVAISADGNTAAIGGTDDSYSGGGAVWVFLRNSGVWTQQGSKLTGNGTRGVPEQGASIAVSADANTIIVGGPGDDSNRGAAWVFKCNDGSWIQQGNKLVGNSGARRFGSSVALSGDGTTALVGGPVGSGAVSVFSQSNGIWTLQDTLIGNAAVGEAGQGDSVALSANGDTAVVGGAEDYKGRGAFWIFVR
jgi:hypothetical protein